MTRRKFIIRGLVAAVLAASVYLGLLDQEMAASILSSIGAAP